MRKILLTTALVLPLSLAAGWAQEEGEPATTDSPGATEQMDPAAPGATIDSGADPAASDPAAPGMEPATPDAAPDAANDAAAPDPLAPDAGTSDTGASDMGAGDATGGTGAAIGDDNLDAGTGDDAAASDAATGVGAGDATAGDTGLERTQTAEEMRSRWITSNKVVAPDGSKIGDVTDLIITEDGKIEAVVVGVGGFLGMGAKNIAIDWGDLDIRDDAHTLTANLTKEDAEAAPSYVFREQAALPGAEGMGE